jgi:hypothetical protein
LDIKTPVTFSIEDDLTGFFGGFGNSHNIVANEETKMIYAVGTGRAAGCAGGLFMVDVSDPSAPTSPGCVSEDGYVHDGRTPELCTFYFSGLC